MGKSKITIQDMYDEIANDILQTNAKDFASTLADSLTEAFKAGEDAANAFEQTVNEVLQNAIVNQLKKKFLENQLQSALDSLYSDMGYWSGDNFIFDGLTEQEIADFKAKVQAAANNYNQALDVYKDLFKDLEIDDDSEDSLANERNPNKPNGSNTSLAAIAASLEHHCEQYGLQPLLGRDRKNYHNP